MVEFGLCYVLSRQESNKKKLQYKNKINFQPNNKFFNLTPKYYYDEKNPDHKSYCVANQVKQKFYREQSNNRKLKDYF
jgi:hypothetical protein